MFQEVRVDSAYPNNVQRLTVNNGPFRMITK